MIPPGHSLLHLGSLERMNYLMHNLEALKMFIISSKLVPWDGWRTLPIPFGAWHGYAVPTFCTEHYSNEEKKDLIFKSF